MNKIITINGDVVDRQPTQSRIEQERQRRGDAFNQMLIDMQAEIDDLRWKRNEWRMLACIFAAAACLAVTGMLWVMSEQVPVILTHIH